MFLKLKQGLLLIMTPKLISDVYDLSRRKLPPRLRSQKKMPALVISLKLVNKDKRESTAIQLDSLNFEQTVNTFEKKKLVPDDEEIF